MTKIIFSKNQTKMINELKVYPIEKYLTERAWLLFHQKYFSKTANFTKQFIIQKQLI